LLLQLLQALAQGPRTLPQHHVLVYLLLAKPLDDIRVQWSRSDLDDAEQDADRFQ
jgi:hypothetical protein